MSTCALYPGALAAPVVSRCSLGQSAPFFLVTSPVPFLGWGKGRRKPHVVVCTFYVFKVTGFEGKMPCPVVMLLPLSPKGETRFLGFSGAAQGGHGERKGRQSVHSGSKPGSVYHRFQKERESGPNEVGGHIPG